MHMASLLKFVECRSYGTYNSEEVTMEHKEETKLVVETEEEEQDVPVPLVTHVKNSFYSIFSNVEMHINNQQNHS